MKEGYSREAYQKNESDIESALDRRASANELSPKFAEQEHLKNEAWGEALAENKERDSHEAGELLSHMQAKHAEAKPAPVAEALENPKVEKEGSHLSDEEMQKFAEKHINKNFLGQFDMGKWHGKDREVFIADQIDARRRDIKNDFFGWTRVIDKFNSWRARHAFKKEFGSSVDDVLAKS